MRSRRTLSIFMSIILVLSTVLVGAPEKDQARAKSAQTIKTLNELREEYGAISIELYNVGGGYLLEPTLYEKDGSSSVGAITVNALENEGKSYTGSTSYFEGFEGDDSMTADWPWYFYEDDDCESMNSMVEMVAEDTPSDPDGMIAAFDYGMMSGWVYTVNDWWASYGASDVIPGMTISDYNTGEDISMGDIIRWHYTVYGYGCDVGYPGNIMAEYSGGNLFTQEMRDDLIFDLAAVNSYYGVSDQSYKNAKAYKEARAVAISPTATSTRISQVQTALEKYIEDTYLTKSEEVSAGTTKGAGASDGSGNDKGVSGEKGSTVSMSNTELKEYAVDCIRQSVTDPIVGSVGGEWAVLTLGKTGEATDNFKNKYREKVKAALVGHPNGKLDTNKSTENERVMIALSSIGDKVVVDGVDLAAPLYDVSYTTKQGINGAIFGLIALDMSGYYKSGESEAQTTAQDPVSVRDDLLRFILDREVSGGGWSLIGDADPDITFMAIQALAPYYSKDTSVKAAVDRALNVMSLKQDENGGFSTSLSGTLTATSESVAQAITGLTSLGIDPRTDSRFIKEGKTLVDNLLTYKVNGGYAHTGNQVNQMATEQAAYASVALWLFDSGKHLYDMAGEKYIAPVPSVSPAPTVTPTVAPSVTPSATPTATPSATPSATPTATPSATPSATPTATPSATPSATPKVSTKPSASRAPEVKNNGVTYKTNGSTAKIDDLPNKTSVTIKNKVVINGKTLKVTKIAKGACKGLTKTKKLTVNMKYLKTVEPGALSGLNKNVVICLPKKYYKKYKKLFMNKKTGYKKTMKFKMI